jgi:hypothetical protein
MIGVPLLLTIAALGQQPPPAFPDPFTRALELADPVLAGSDVVIAQQLLRRDPAGANLTAADLSLGYGASSAAAVRAFQRASPAAAALALDGAGVLGPRTATALLAARGEDGFAGRGLGGNWTAAQLGYLYKIHVPVHRNRSIETVASLYGAHGALLLSFPARTHGHRADHADHPWPDFSSDGGRSQFASSGNTPTGLMSVDLNSPEDEPDLYGPYPVNRAVAGLVLPLPLPPRGGARADASAPPPPPPPLLPTNAGFLLPHIRNGILIHTGNWSAAAGWTPAQPMPNSAGCIHSHPDSIKAIWQALVGAGVEVRKNPFGALPYPYAPQGIMAVELVD